MTVASPHAHPSTRMHIPEDLAASPGRRQETMLGLITRRFLRHRLATASLIVLLALALSAILAPLAPHDPNALSPIERLQGPSRDHWLGTDKAGRDIFARTLWGGRISLIIGLAATGVALVIGTTIGALAGYFGGKTDAVLMRLTLCSSSPQH
jgi:peptide/nickel transport system permease protein